MAIIDINIPIEDAVTDGSLNPVTSNAVFDALAAIPSTSGLVPYTGATTNVDLGTHKLTANDLVVNHPSGSGDAAAITKGGNGEALKVIKTSGSGNAASITGGVTLISELHLTADLADTYIASAATWNAKQDALVSGTNIKTVNGNSLLGSGDLVVGGSITIGTTPITSGTDGRVLFQAGGVVQQDADLFWDNTNKRLGIGATPDASTRLDVRAQGALSTDIAFRVRNSANTGNLLEVQGDGKYRLGDANGGLSNAFSHISDGRMFMAKSGSNFIELNATTGQNRFFFSSNGVEINVGVKELTVQGSTCALRFLQNNVQINTGGQAGSGTNAVMIQNGTAPSTSPTDHSWIYSADITAGNAAPHFRTENGAVIKLYQETTGIAAAAFVSNTSLILDDSATYGGYTMGQVVAALKSQGLLA